MTDFDPHHPSEAFLRTIDVHTLLPQQEPFVMIGSLVGYTDSLTVTETAVADACLFIADGHLEAEGLIENIAQTCAARIGYVNKYILRKGIQLGFIGAVRHFRLGRLPRAGECIRTEVHIREEVFGMTLADAAVYSGEELLAQTEMKIAVKEEAGA